MPFVKLDCGMLDSTIWVDREAREIFITALLMAEPHELKEPAEQIEVRSLLETGFIVPAGWYGFVPAAGTGIIRRAGIDQKAGMEALERLCGPESESRTPDHDGRRLARINGGYIVLNFDKYRQKDHTGAERQKRFRDRHRNTVTDDSNAVTERHITQAEAQADAEAQAALLNEFPESLRDPSFLATWMEWQQHRKEIRHKLTPTTIVRQLANLGKYSLGVAIQAINISIEKGWTGLFPEKVREPAKIKKPSKPVDEMTEQERREYAFGK